MAGNYKFIFEGDPPNAANLPSDDVLGVTVILLTCSYHEEVCVCVPVRLHL